MQANAASSLSRLIHTPDGVRIAVHEAGDPTCPTIVAVHGYPDNHHVWDGVVAVLADQFHVVAYDVRGCGESDKPAGRAAYRMERLVDDFIAVLDAVTPDAPVHLLAHDWGSIQSWPAVADERTTGRIASFTSISGPSLDYAGVWMRDLRGHARASLRQLAHSYYIGLFQLPQVPEAAVRSGLLDRLAGFGDATTEPPRSTADKINGLWLYRANMMQRLGRPAPVATAVPVQVIVPADDAYVTPAMATDAPRGWVENLTVTPVAGDHWVVTERPDEIGALVAEFATAHAPHQNRQAT